MKKKKTDRGFLTHQFREYGWNVCGLSTFQVVKTKNYDLTIHIDNLKYAPMVWLTVTFQGISEKTKIEGYKTQEELWDKVLGVLSVYMERILNTSKGERLC